MFMMVPTLFFSRILVPYLGVFATCFREHQLRIFLLLVSGVRHLISGVVVIDFQDWMPKFLGSGSLGRKVGIQRRQEASEEVSRSRSLISGRENVLRMAGESPRLLFCSTVRGRGTGKLMYASD